MPSSFRYLTRQGHGNRGQDYGSQPRERTADEAVEARYKLGDLVARPVVRDELNNRFLVFESRREFLQWQESVPERERCFHEVIFGSLAQRIKFDIDAPAYKLDAIPDETLAAACRGAPAGHLQPEPDPDVGELLDALLGEAPPEPAQPVPAAATAATAQPAPAPAQLAKAHAVVSLLLEAMLDELYVGYYGLEDLLPAREDVVVTDSSGPAAGGWKFSYHLMVLPHAVADHAEAAEFSSRVLERLPPPVRALVDPDVNKRIQCFRLAGSAKLGTGRVKHATDEMARIFGTARAVAPDDLFVTAAPGARVLPRVYTEESATARDGGRGKPRRGAAGLRGAAIRAVLDLAAREGVTTGHEFTEARGTLLCFGRVDPSDCRICGEVHHRDNSLMLSLAPVEGGHEGAWPGTGPVKCRLVEHCRQARGRGREVGELTLQAEDLRAAESGRGAAKASPAAAKASPAAGLGERLAARVAAVRGGRVNPHDALASEFERLPAAQKTVYTEPEMRDYELVPTLAVAAQMKLGKTKALRRYLDAHFPADGLETRVVRFVTFRQTFSRGLAGAFSDFVLYSDVQGDLDVVRHPRLIVQAESLHRLRMPARGEPVDLLVLDEAESVLGQFNSGLHRHFGAAFAMFQWMLRTARHVVVLDANLGDRSFRTLARMRPAHPPHFHWNRFARAADDVFRFTADQGAWLERLHAALRAGQKVVVPTNSLAEARAFDEALRREFPGKRIALYSSETAAAEKARHFGDVHTHWSGLDALIYTPTCSAGVSYELEHFDALFGYFCDVSCDVETCRQMLGRVRNLRTREHTICIRATGAALPATVDAIRRLVYDKRAGLYRRIEDAALQYAYEADGTIAYYESDYFYLWLETTRVTNLSRNDFAHRFVDQVADTGARIEVLADVPGAGAPGAALLMGHRETRGALRAARCAAVADAADLSPEEASGVRESLRAQLDVEPALRLAYEKHLLRDAYAWHGRPLDAGFVEAYHDAGARRVYRNLCCVTEGATVVDSLRLMRQREAGHYEYVMETRAPATAHVNESRDLLRDKTVYVFQAHFLAVWLIHICGFVFAGKERVHEAALEARLRAAVPLLRRAVDRIVFEFEVARPGLDRLAREPDRALFLSGMLRFVNAVLRQMYGVQIQRLPKSAGGGAYRLGHSATGKLFVFSHEPEADDAPGGARPHIPSNLAVDRGLRAHVDLFLEDVYYGPRAATPDDDSVGHAPVTDDDSDATPDGDSAATSDGDSTGRAPVAPDALDAFLSETFAEVVARGVSRKD